MLPQQLFRLSLIIAGLLFGSYAAYNLHRRENMPSPMIVLTPEPVADVPVETPQVSTPSPSPSDEVTTTKKTPRPTAKATPVPVTSGDVETLSSVSPVEDLRTIGYPDSRKLARGENGVLYAAFRKKEASSGSKSQIYVATSNDSGKTWHLANSGKPVSEGVGSYDQRVPSILVMGRTIHVTWYGIDNSLSGADHREIKYVTSTDGGASFSRWRNIGVIDGYNGQNYWQEHPVIAARNSQNIYIAWEGKDATHDKQQIKFSASTDGGKSWSKPKNISETADRTQSRPDILVRGNDIFILGYGFSKDERNRIAITVSHDNGSSWQAWTPISSDNYDSRHVSGALDQQGHFHIAYRQTDGQKSWIIYRSSSDGVVWSSEQHVLSSGSGQYFPSLSIVNNTPYIAWTETDHLSEPLPNENIDLPFIGVVAKRVNNNFIKLNNQVISGAWLTMNPGAEKPEMLFMSAQDSGKYILRFARFNP